MPLLLEDLKNNKLYKKKIFLPTDGHNKRKNSVIMLMTPDYKSSVKTMNLPYFINTRRFESYYTEKNISFVLTEDNKLYANSEDIPIIENSISSYTRMNLDTIEELDEYDIPHDNLEYPFSCQAYVYNTKCYGFIIMTACNTNIFRIEAYSYQLKKDLIQSAMIFFNPKTVTLWNESDEKLYKSFGFKRSKVLRDYFPMMIKEDSVPVLEGIGTTKIDLEIKLWEAQIKITELIIHNRNDANWMKNMYESLKRKLNKIPLDDYAEELDDSLDSLKRKLSDQKATLEFYANVKSLEVKDDFDISDAIKDYVDWVVKLSCPKALKIKILNRVISSYNISIRECEYNLARYRKLDDVKKRMENGVAIITKITSAFSFITGGPLGIIKGKLIGGILPKTRKKNVLSEDELVAKIELYKGIVESLEKMKEDSLSESSLLEFESNHGIDGIQYQLDNPQIIKKNYDAIYKAAYNYYTKSIYLKKVFKIINNSAKIKKLSDNTDKYYDIWEQIYKEWGSLDILYDGTVSNIPNHSSDSIDAFWKEFNEVEKLMKDAIIDTDYFYIESEGVSTDIYINLGIKPISKKKGISSIFHKESTILTEAGNPVYSKPYNRKEIIDNYGKDTCDRLMKDKAHVFRADSGIELIHKEPTIEELNRIKRNWDMMPSDMKKKSDEMSMKLYGKNNETHYKELVSSYNTTLSEAGNPSIPMDILEFHKELNKWPYGTLINGKVEAKDPDFTKYKTLTIAQMDKYNVGVCWDFVHYEATWFKKHGYSFSTYFILIDNNKDCPSHTFLIFYLPETKKYYYFESSWGKYKRIEEFNSESEAVKTVQQRHLDMYGKKGDKLYKTKYDAVSTSLENLTTIQYMDRMLKNSNIDTTLSESFVFSNNDLYINFDKFKNGSSNICFVTGLSGGGKSTKAKELANQYHAEWIELDLFEQCGKFSGDGIKKAGEVFYDYLSSHKDLWDRLSNHKVNGKELRDEITNFIRYTISWCSSHKDKKYIIEGVQLYSLMDIPTLKSKPIIIINTSMLKAFARRISRTYKGRKDEDSDWKNMVSELPQLVAAYLYDEKTFNQFKKELLSEETKYSSDQLYFASDNDKYDDELLSSADPDKFLSIGMTNAIKFAKGQSDKYYIYQTEDIDQSECKDTDDKIQVDNDPTLRLMGKIELKDNDPNTYEWLWHYNADGTKVYDWQESTLLEDKLSAEDKKKLSDSDFGIPSERRYPMPDASHVKAAVRMFNHVEPEHEKELARNIKSKIKELNIADEINVSKDNRFSKYFKEEYNIRVQSIEDPIINGRIMQTEDTITFLEGNDEVLVEADAAYNSMLRRILYSERIKNQKEILTLYDTLKEDCPWVKYTYVNYKRYTNRNLFIDWSYYTKSFFKNNFKKYDKAVDLYLDFLSRFIDDKRLTALGYTRKTVFIPVDDWIPNKDMNNFDYRKNLNPISIIRRLVFRDIEKLHTMWGNCPFVFTGTHGFFVMDFSTFEKRNLPKFMQNVKRLIENTPITDDDDESDNSIGGIVNLVVDRLEDNSNGTIKINNLTGASKITVDSLLDKDKAIKGNAPEKDPGTTEEQLVTAIAKTAVTNGTADEVMEKIDNDVYIKQLVIDIRSNTDDEVNINPTRAARMRALNNQFMTTEIANKKVGEIIANTSDTPLPETALPVDTINDEWKHMKYINHAKEYNVDEDIVRCLHHFATATLPIAVRDINVENTSTSEDWINTWSVAIEDSKGKRSILKFDIPRLKNNRFMHLRGNDKTISGQLINLPIIKTEGNTCQMTSNYNKIFFTGYGTSKGKSYVVADRLIKTLTKGPIKGIEVVLGDNSRICSKYELPADYIDLASVISKITYFNKHIGVKYTYYFNQDELFKNYGNIIKDKDSLTVGIVECNNFDGPKPIHSVSDQPVSYEIYSMLSTNEEFAKIYNSTSNSVRYTYSKASILNTDIPIAVIIGYYIGLIRMLDRANVKYAVIDKRPKYDRNTQDVIRLSDASIIYDLNYDSSMLLNGLKECDLEQYSLREINSKRTWLECLDLFGGRLKADGLDMFYDLMMDPITVTVCRKYMLPEDFIGALLYANVLLSDNKYNKHSNVTGNRYRSMEIIAGYTYKAICNSYTQYRRELRAGRDAKLTMKQTAVIDLLFADNTFGDLSALSDLLEVESANSVSFKGLSGMNTDRAYGLDKRVFDDSMVNVLSLSTGFAANTGISRQSTIDMDIESTRGYIKKTKTDDMSITKSFCMTEALTPMGTTSDDPFRSAMTFIQTSKHGMRVKQSDPLLVTNGSEQALPYMTSNTFTFKSTKAGKVKEKTDDYMVLEYNDKSTEVVDLREKILKNSDGGMYIPVKLDTDLKEGNLFKSNEIVAHDPQSYSDDIGPHGNLSYDVGTFVKFAVMQSDEGFEDSCIETEWISNAMASTVVINKEYTLPKDTNVYFIATKGQNIQEGEPLLIFQNAFDEEDANMLIKTLSDEDGDDVVAELGRIPITSKVTGVVKDIKILRTAEINELSPSLKKIVTNYEKQVKQFNKVLEHYDLDKAKIADATYKLEPTGKLKNAKDSVRIEFSLAYEDKFSVGDKAVCYSAMKGVSKGIIPAGDEPTSSYRPDERLNYLQTINGELRRMVGSVLKVGALNKVMVELARQSCDIMGIKWKYFDEY